MLESFNPLYNKPLYHENIKTPLPTKTSGFKEQWNSPKVERKGQADVSEKMIEYDREDKTVREQYFAPRNSAEEKSETITHTKSKPKNKSLTGLDSQQNPVKAARVAMRNSKPHDAQTEESRMPKKETSTFKGQSSHKSQRHPVALKTTKLSLSSNNKKEKYKPLTAEKHTDHALKTGLEKKLLLKKQLIKENNLSSTVKNSQKNQEKRKVSLPQKLSKKEKSDKLNTKMTLSHQISHDLDKASKTASKKDHSQETTSIKQRQQLSQDKREVVSSTKHKTHLTSEQNKANVAEKITDFTLEQTLNNKDEQEPKENKVLTLKSSKEAKTLNLQSKEAAPVNNSHDTTPIKAEKAEIIIEAAPFEARNNSAPATRLSFNQMVESRVNQLLEGPQGHLVKQLQVQLQNQQQAEIRLSLQPEQLGEVRLHVRLQGEQARTQISVEQSGTAQLMQEALSSFAQSFSEHGYEQTEFDIVVEENKSQLISTISETTPSLMQQGGDFLLRDQHINYII